MAYPLLSENPNAAFRRLRAQGVTLPSGPNGKYAAQRMMAGVDRGSFAADVASYRNPVRDAANSYSRTGRRELSDHGMKRTGMMGGASRGGTDIQMAMPNMTDPMTAFTERAWWWLKDGDEERQRIKIWDWCTLLYKTHDLIPSLIDIFSRFPLLQMEFVHEDKALANFYNELFLDSLDYQTFLYNLNREFWLKGNAFALGSWHDGIGCWDADELINPEDVVVTKNRALRSHEFHIKVPEEIKKLISTQEPKIEYDNLVELYPDLVNWAQQDKEIPVSNILMKQHKFTTDPWDNWGSPILMRAFNALQQEQSLQAAQDAVADRLYSPLILANLGLDDFDQDGPWLPSPAQLDDLRDDLNVALSSKFRLIVHHHGLDIKNAWGREIMPDFNTDFDRLDARLMQIFGIGADLIKGGSSGTYAAGALNRDLVENLMNTYQVGLQKFVKSRVEVVAERQGHVEYTTRGGQRYPVMEMALMTNEETGEQYVEERPKLAIPRLQLKALNLRDEKGERDWLKTLKNDLGFPVSSRAFSMNIPLEFDEEVETLADEKIELEVAEARRLDALFRRLYMEDLPIDPNYKDMYQDWLKRHQVAQTEVDPNDPLQIPKVKLPAGEGASEPYTDLSDPVNAPNLTGGPGGGTGGGGEPLTDGEAADVYKEKTKELDMEMRPEESDEQRKTMPKNRRGMKEGSILDEAQREMRVAYGEFDFPTPAEAKISRKSLPKGIRIQGTTEVETEDPDEPEEG